jgi:heavy metal translocating P-type ATPase
VVALDLPRAVAQKQDSACALCGLSLSRPVAGEGASAGLEYCCYGCRTVHGLVADELAAGVPLAEAMGRAGLDLAAPCCRGILRGDPEVEAERLLSRLMINAIFAMMVMASSLALYSEAWLEWGEAGGELRALLQLAMLAFATPAVLLLAVPILEDAVLTWQLRRRLTTSALIALGSLAAYLFSVYGVFIGSGATYFETATMTLLLVTVGRWLDARSLASGNAALEALIAAAPDVATRVDTRGVEERVAVELLSPGEVIRLRPGEALAVDGRIKEGLASFLEANITGEARPADKAPGDSVYAGTINLDGGLLVEVTKVGEERVMGRLIRLLDESRLHRARIEQLADRIAARFVPAVLVLAVIAFVYWTAEAGPGRGLNVALSVLLIACPCALGIATPLAIWTAVGRAARAGIFVRDHQVIESLASARRVFFDKTGTLTTGRVQLAEVVPAGAVNPVAATPSPADPDALLAAAAALELRSEHPFGEAIHRAAGARGLGLPAVTDIRALPGLGVIGSVDGRQIAIGSPRFMAQRGLELPPTLARAEARLGATGHNLVRMGWSGEVRAVLAMREVLRPEAEAAVAGLKQRGLAVEILTGDGRAAAQALAARLDVPVRAELMPEDKLRIVAESAAEEDTSRGATIVVGDGVNDAPALARADVGIALGCGADITREAADLSFLGSDLRQVAWSLDLARRCRRTIAWNLAWAFAYNALGIGLAVTGRLHPILAAVVMVLSSALVVANSLRIARFDPLPERLT